MKCPPNASRTPGRAKHPTPYTTGGHRYQIQRRREPSEAHETAGHPGGEGGGESNPRRDAQPRTAAVTNRGAHVPTAAVTDGGAHVPTAAVTNCGQS